jgi:hypothetical protein
MTITAGAINDRHQEVNDPDTPPNTSAPTDTLDLATLTHIFEAGPITDRFAFVLGFGPR